MTSVAAMTLTQRVELGDRWRQPGRRPVERAVTGRRLLRGAEGRRMSGGLTRLTIASARDRLEAGRFSAVELTRAHLDAIADARPLNAFITETPELALARAAESDARRAKGDTRGRSTVSRSRSRICSAPKGCARPPARTSWTASSRPMNRRSPPNCARRARSCWARQISTSSPWARRIRPVFRSGEESLGAERRQGFGAGRFFRRLGGGGGGRVCASVRPVPTPAARSASRRRSAASSASSRHTVVAPAGASSRLPHRSTRRGR